MSQRSHNIHEPHSAATGASRSALSSHQEQLMQDPSNQFQLYEGQYVQRSRQQLATNFTVDSIPLQQPAQHRPPQQSIYHALSQKQQREARPNRQNRSVHQTPKEQYGAYHPKKHQPRTHIPYRPANYQNRHPPQLRPRVPHSLHVTSRTHSAPLAPVIEGSVESSTPRSSTPHLPVEGGALNAGPAVTALLTHANRCISEVEAHPPHEEEDITFFTNNGTQINMFTKSPGTVLVSLTSQNGKPLRLFSGQKYRLIGGFLYQEWYFLSDSANSEAGLLNAGEVSAGSRLVAGRSFKFRGLRVRNEVDGLGRRRVGFMDVWERTDGRVGVAFRKGWSDGRNVYEDAPM